MKDFALRREHGVNTVLIRTSCSYVNLVLRDNKHKVVVSLELREVRDLIGALREGLDDLHYGEQKRDNADLSRRITEAVDGILKEYS